MKKIKITTKQAELLGIKKLNENEESGLKASGLSMGDLVVRVVIEGGSVPANKDRIIYLVTRQDPEANVAYFEATGKIVGNVKSIKLDSIARDLKSLDPNISIKKKAQAKALKEGVKNIVKITKEQYNRIFASGLINEGEEVKGGLNRVDKSFKKEFAGKDVENLKPVAENDFDIKKPVAGIPDSKMKNSKPAKVEEAEDPFKNEVIELIKYLYRKNDKLSPFWKSHGLSYDAICDTLLSKGLIIAKDGKYVLSRTAGSPEAAIQAIEDQLRASLPQQQQSSPASVDEDNYPAGAENDPKAPYNQKDTDMTTPTKAKEIKLEPVAYNGEVIILKDPKGELYAFYHWALDNKDWLPYASVERHYTGKDEDGQPDYDYDYDSAEKDADVIAHYVNDNLGSLSKGEGLEAWENGVDLVKIDEPLKQELLSLFDKDKSIVKALGPLEEASDEDLMKTFKDNLKHAFTPKPPTGETPEDKQSRIVNKLQQLKKQEEERRKAAGEMDEVTGAASAGAFTAPMNFKPEAEEQVQLETLTVQGAGNFQYDTPGLANVGRNGEFKKGPKTKAETTPQWAGGEFVEQPECSKPNNNKEAQNGGCNSGASSLRTKKAKGSINAPSLGESEIYETIAKKTGKTIAEVKAIIESKRAKA